MSKQSMENSGRVESTTNVDPERLPEVAGEVFARERLRALSSGRSVMVVDGSHLVLVSPDGRRKILRELPRRPISSKRIAKGVATSIEWKSRA